MNSGGGYSQSTLNAFARYCGHRSFTDWKEKWGRKAEAPVEAPTPAPRRPMPGFHPSGVDRREVFRWIEKNKDPETFQPTLREFRGLQGGLVGMYERGSLDMSLWFEVKRHHHIKHFIIEKFPPMDYMATFGTPMVEDFLASNTRFSRCLNTVLPRAWWPWTSLERCGPNPGAPMPNPSDNPPLYDVHEFGVCCLP